MLSLAEHCGVGKPSLTRIVILVTNPRSARFCRFVATLAVVASTGCGDPGADGAVGDDAPNFETGGETTLARGISIEEIELNQGTRIPIGSAGDWIDGPDRLGFVIASRDSLLRVHYSVVADWEPRDIEARLTLVAPDKTTTVATQVATVEHSSQPEALDGTFWFELRNELGQTEAGTEYRVELWETVPGAGGQFAEGVAVNPSEGPEPIGFEAVAMQIKVVLVPIEYEGTLPDLSDAVQRQLVDNLYEQNPVTEVVWDVHPPVVYDDNLSSLASLLPVMSQLRSAEAVEPNVYYHAFVDVGAQSLGGVFGISDSASDEQADAASRVSATVLWSVKPATAADTFTHETGHAQGLAHVECPDTNAAEPDVGYPHPDGRIGAWGFGVRRKLVYDPAEAFDYMSYCSPTWVSDWTWNKTYARIRTLTAWDSEGTTSPRPTGTLLIRSGRSRARVAVVDGARLDSTRRTSPAKTGSSSRSRARSSRGGGRSTCSATVRPSGSKSRSRPSSSGSPRSPASARIRSATSIRAPS